MIQPGLWLTFDWSPPARVPDTPGFRTDTPNDTGNQEGPNGQVSLAVCASIGGLSFPITECLPSLPR